MDDLLNDKDILTNTSQMLLTLKSMDMKNNKNLLQIESEDNPATNTTHQLEHGIDQLIKKHNPNDWFKGPFPFDIPLHQTNNCKSNYYLN